MSNVKQIADELTKRLKADLEHLIGLLNEANLTNGGEIKWIGTLWEKMTYKEKALWLLYNVVFKSIGQRERGRIELINRDKLELYGQEVELARAHDTGMEEYTVDEDYVPYPVLEEVPSWAVLNPKGIIKVDCVIRLKMGIDYIMVGIDEQLRRIYEKEK